MFHTQKLSICIVTEHSQGGHSMAKIKEYFKNPLSTGISVGYLLSAVSVLYYLVSFVIVFVRLDDRIFPLSPFFAVLVFVMNFALFPLSSMENEFNYDIIKKILLGVNYWSVCLCLLSMLFHYTGIFLFPKVFSLKITPFVSAGLIVGLARYIELLLCGFSFYGMLNLFLSILRNEEVMQELMFFRLSKVIDFRENTDYKYDLVIGHNLKTKQEVVLQEADRFLHMTDDGTSGTGKSSMLLLPGIRQDLDTKLRNVRMQKRLIQDMVDNGRAYRCQYSETFNIMDYKAYPMYQDEYEGIMAKYKSAGQTIMAPDASMLDKVYTLCKVRGFTCNRIDPSVNDKGEFKEGFVGFNPFYIEPEVFKRQDRNYVIAVDHKASVYRDVMQQLYELDGKGGDPYFTGLNKAANYNMTILCILVYPYLYKRQANPVDCLRELNAMQPQEITEEIEQGGKLRTVRRMIPNPQLLRLLECYNTNVPDTVREAFDDSISMYFESIFIVNPARGQQIYDQSLGLRQLIQSFVLNPNIRPIITTDDDHTIVLSRAIERGEITVFNFYHAMGSSLARVFGLFFLLNFDVEVKGRLVDDSGARADLLNPHFFRLDELPVILHPIINSQISLYRKYQVSCEYAFQSLAQMSETPATRFLASSLMSCATQVIFGRTNLEEMRLYSELGGMRKESTDQVSYTEGSIWLDEGITQSIRTSLQETERHSADDVRRRNFGECTIFSTRLGAPLDPILAKLDFVADSEFQNKLTAEDDFADYPVLAAPEDEHIPDTFHQTALFSYAQDKDDIPDDTEDNVTETVEEFTDEEDTAESEDVFDFSSHIIRNEK